MREWAEDWHVDARLPVSLDPGTALLRRTGDAGRVDQVVAHRTLGRFSVAARPRLGDRSSLGVSKAVPQSTAARNLCGHLVKRLDRELSGRVAARHAGDQRLRHICFP
jgi:hypothetical protein